MLCTKYTLYTIGKYVLIVHPSVLQYKKKSSKSMILLKFLNINLYTHCYVIFSYQIVSFKHYIRL